VTVTQRGTVKAPLSFETMMWHHSNVQIFHVVHETLMKRAFTVLRVRRKCTMSLNPT
jgi:hypothetical protein